MVFEVISTRNINVEDKTHFLFNKIDHIIPNYKQLPISTLIMQLTTAMIIIFTCS